MKKSRYTAEQITFALRQSESRTTVPDVYRKMSTSEQTFYRWKKKYAIMDVQEDKKIESLVGHWAVPKLVFGKK